MVKAKKKHLFDPDYAVPPGETLREVLDSLDMTQKDLGIRTELTNQTINRIIQGEQPITYETASRLELVTGVPARMWNNLESQYREQLARISERTRLQGDLKWLKMIPTKELIARKAITSEEDKTLLLREVLSFFGVSSTAAWHQLWETPQVAARRSQCFESHPGPTATWIRLGELQAHGVTCQPYNKTNFLNAVKQIRGLTTKLPETFLPKMKSLCANAGVALVLVPEIKKAPWHGVTKWLSPYKAMVALNLRGKSEDQFWFSFFHEAAHVLHDTKKEIYINDGSDANPAEKRANKFASDLLIPSCRLPDLLRLKDHEQVCELAKNLEISPGIVAGRFQRETKKWTYFRKLIKKFTWSESN